MEGQDLASLQQLCDERPRFRLLFEEHLLLEKQLTMLDQKPHLTPEEELERKKIQKLKLAGKDEMEHIKREWTQ
ncbi:hypothetical protein A7E78_04925 [Syntrophotalea acetylenivorans]|jgi:uncharacterized protein YdcH (DUF465 family)|uniref:DUF465 domain-containing protein n=1 Tax=Syntrophotalea acetylenivorans TaxID=1842532 RepID=A0A1L3GMS9_9BACT|nr:DUF465 domain-containing protein [Syntrophotalea acetylenivorans]APG27239.1 hypothetical protein A7E78_04925 [Syntrophotalea acetylenivorans]